VLLSFMQAGHIASTFRGAGAPQEVAFPAGSAVFLTGSDVRAAYDMPAGQRLRALELALTPGLVRRLLDDPAAAPLPAEPPADILRGLLRAAEGAGAGLYAAGGAIAPAASLALEQVARCSLTGALRRLYLEGKAFELLALALAPPAAPARASTRRRRPLRPDDAVRVRRARDALDQRLEDPPSLVALARQVGLNDFKLKQAFKQVFGTTVYGYVHGQRMDRARRLLEARDVSVTEAAGAVGYTNMSHFAAAFRRRFGVRPSDLRGRRSVPERR
jgi:AraC-like DNA-binding protein